MRGSTGISGGTSHSSIGPTSAIGRLLMRRSSPRARLWGAGERPATVSYAPAAGQSPPGIGILAPRQSEGPPGGYSDGPSICLSILPPGFALPTVYLLVLPPGGIRVLPASLATPTTCVSNHDQNHSERCHLVHLLPPLSGLPSSLVTHRHFL